MSDITKFNRFCSRTEDVLTGLSVVLLIEAPRPLATIYLPFAIGFAAVKFTLGTVQTITALALGILSTPFRFCSDDAAAFNNHCWSHVVHGLGNMIAAIVEMIPGVNIAVYFLRTRDGFLDDGHIHTNPEHQHKYIPYSDVIQEDWKEGFLPARNQNAGLYKNTSNPLYFSPTHFRQVTGFNAIPVN